MSRHPMDFGRLYPTNFYTQEDQLAVHRDLRDFGVAYGRFRMEPDGIAAEHIPADLVRFVAPVYRRIDELRGYAESG